MYYDYFNNRCDLDMWNIKWNAEPEFLNTIFYAAQGKEYPLSEDFIKKNEVIIPSIVGKNLLKESVEIKTRETSYCIDSDVLIRSVPSKYKLELVIEKTGPDPRLTVNYIDGERNWCYLIPEKKKVEGGTLEIYDNGKSNNIIPKAEKIVVGITEEYSPYIEYLGLHINGKDCLLKSVKVVE